MAIVRYTIQKLIYKARSILLWQQLQKFIQKMFFAKKRSKMQKQEYSCRKYCTKKSRLSMENEPISISEGYKEDKASRDERRILYQREDFTHKSRTPQFLKKTQITNELFKKTPEKYGISKSLIVLQRYSRFHQVINSKDRYLVKTNRTPRNTNQSRFAEDSPRLQRKLKYPLQNLALDAFEEMAKKQKQTSIPPQSIMSSPKNTKQSTQTYLLRQLTQTEDTITDQMYSFRPSSPKASDFHQVKLLGKGKNGQVYLAIHKSTGLACAMKIIKKKDINLGSPAERQIMHNQLLRQIKIQMYLCSPNLVQLQYIYLIQQLGIDGQLYQLMRRNGRLSEESTALLARQILGGIKSMHQRQIIHRDIKPQNIVLIYGTAKLCDFGWSVHCPVQLRSTICGTPLYLSPQVLVGDQYNQKIDIWAYGTLIYQLFTGQNPFGIKNKSDLKKIVTQQLSFPDNFPRRLGSFLKIILNKNSSQRPLAIQVQKHQFLRKYAEIQTSEQLADL